LVGHQEECPTQKNECQGVGVVIYLEQGGTDCLHIATVTPKPGNLFSHGIQNGLTFWYLLPLVVLEQRPCLFVLTLEIVLLVLCSAVENDKNAELGELLGLELVQW